MIRESAGSQGLTFTGDGPQMTGTWVNPTTGHKFTVRDCFFEDGNFMVLTTNGQRLDYNMLQNYVQCTDENGKNVDLNIQPKEEVPSEIEDLIEDNYMTPEDNIMAGLGNLNTQPVSTRIQTPQTIAVDADLAMIKRVLDSHDGPGIDAGVVWPHCPYDQIKTLVNTLGVPVEKISEYYVNQFDLSDIFNKLSKTINEWVTDVSKPSLSPVQPVMEDENPKIEPKIEKKVEKKTTKPKKDKKK